ncbi:MAG: hypothetical protein GY696_32625 [Gammaproteobacteria bacterium]|nr:hypothetical protein [Gammaproteobacteria bacterium]
MEWEDRCIKFNNLRSRTTTPTATEERRAPLTPPSLILRVSSQGGRRRQHILHRYQQPVDTTGDTEPAETRKPKANQENQTNNANLTNCILTLFLLRGIQAYKVDFLDCRNPNRLERFMETTACALAAVQANNHLEKHSEC